MPVAGPGGRAAQPRLGKSPDYIKNDGSLKLRIGEREIIFITRFLCHVDQMRYREVLELAILSAFGTELCFPDQSVFHKKQSKKKKSISKKMF